jgi:uncharacterized membrane protein YkvA (DUF1232 family)
MKHPWRSWFRRDERKAKRLVRNPVAVLRAVESASDHAQHARGPLGRVWEDLQTAMRMVRAWGRRDYRGVAPSTIVLIVAGLLYLLSPLDAVIDAIPVLGFIDDALVLGWVLAQVRSELVVFRTWERQRELAAEARPDTTAGYLTPNSVS